jgi:hypothetical protein
MPEGAVIIIKKLIMRYSEVTLAIGASKTFRVLRQ